VPLKKQPKGLPYRISFLELDHADPCFGYRLEIGGKRIAYCTDTGPCENMEKLAKNADLLISECTMLPGAEIFQKWPHLNPEEAARMAENAGAKRLVLTHFDASNYPNIALRKKAESASRRTFNKTLAANDGMVVEI
jgi:ribonuclease BN (tRNA processing enzyme)